MWPFIGNHPWKRPQFAAVSSEFSNIQTITRQSCHRMSPCVIALVHIVCLSVFSEANRLSFLHSHLLSCLPVFDSRQVHFAELSAALTLHPCFLLRNTHTHTHIYKISLPHCVLYLPASAAQFICPAVCVGDVNYLYCQPPLLLIRLNSSSPRGKWVFLHSLFLPLCLCAACVAP